MPLAHWRRSRIIGIWLIGLAVESAVLTTQWFASADARAESRQIDADLDSFQRGLRTATPLSPRQRDSLKAMLAASSDSLGIRLERHGDTTVVRMPAQMERSWNTFFQGISRGIDQAILVATVELFLIPSLLILLTAVWLIKRRRLLAANGAA